MSREARTEQETNDVQVVGLGAQANHAGGDCAPAQHEESQPSVEPDLVPNYLRRDLHKGRSSSHMSLEREPNLPCVHQKRMCYLHHDQVPT